MRICPGHGRLITRLPETAPSAIASAKGKLKLFVTEEGADVTVENLKSMRRHEGFQEPGDDELSLYDLGRVIEQG